MLLMYLMASVSARCLDAGHEGAEEEYAHASRCARCTCVRAYARVVGVCLVMCCFVHIEDVHAPTTRANETWDQRLCSRSPSHVQWSAGSGVE
jgi:hypothetical protein